MSIFPVENGVRTGEVLHKGCVLLIAGEDYKVMSDDYGWAHYAMVWSNGKTLKVHLDVDNWISAHGEVDATPEIRAAYAAWQAENARVAALREALAMEERFRIQCLEPKMGYPAIVARGRKVPKGTTGMVSWCDGFRVGITDDQGNRHFTNITNVDRVFDRLDGETWSDTFFRLNNVPVVSEGHRVRVNATGVEGLVFWKRDGRCGVRTSDTKVNGKYVDVVWVYETAVTILPSLPATPVETVPAPSVRVTSQKVDTSSAPF